MKRVLSTLKHAGHHKQPNGAPSTTPATTTATTTAAPAGAATTTGTTAAPKQVSPTTPPPSPASMAAGGAGAQQAATKAPPPTPPRPTPSETAAKANMAAGQALRRDTAAAASTAPSTPATSVAGPSGVGQQQQQQHETPGSAIVHELERSLSQTATSPRGTQVPASTQGQEPRSRQPTGDYVLVSPESSREPMATKEPSAPTPTAQPTTKATARPSSAVGMGISAPHLGEDATMEVRQKLNELDSLLQSRVDKEREGILAIEKRYEEILNRYEALLTQRERELDQLQRQLRDNDSEWRRRVDMMRGDLNKEFDSKFRQREGMLMDELRDREARLTGMREEMEGMQLERQNFHKRLAELNDTVNYQRDLIAQKDTESADRIRAREHDFHEKESQWGNKLRGMNEELEKREQGFKKDLSYLQSRVRELEDQSQKQRGDFDSELRRQRGQLEGELSNMENKYRQELNKLNDELSMRRREQGDLDRLRRDMGPLQSQLEDLQRRLAKEQQSHQQSENMMNEIRNERDQLAMECRAGNQELKNVRDEMEKLVRRVQASGRGETGGDRGKQVERLMELLEQSQKDEALALEKLEELRRTHESTRRDTSLLSELRSRLAELERDKMNIEKELANKNLANRHLLEELMDRDRSLVRAEQSSVQESGKRQQALAQLEGLMQERNVLYSRLQERDAEIDRLRRDMSRERDDSQKYIDELRRHLRAMQQETEVLARSLPMVGGKGMGGVRGGQQAYA